MHEFDTDGRRSDNVMGVIRMRLGAFDIIEPLPLLREPHALAMVRPWTDAGSVGALALLELEHQCGSRQLSALARPGTFYDLTRYRPTVYLRDGRRELAVPNTIVSTASPPDGPDLVIIKMLEPHMQAETFVDSVLLLLERLGVRRYIWVGSMYDSVPHTRPLLVSGGAVGAGTEEEMRRLGIMATDYQGPSTMTFQIIQRAPTKGIEAMWCIVHLPRYVQVQEDYVGKLRLMGLLRQLYAVEIDESDLDRAREQMDRVERALQQNPELAAVLPHLEARYAARIDARDRSASPLPADVERFLRELNNRHGAD